MSRYRIVKYLTNEGDFKYEMQKKFPILNVWCHTNYKLYDTLDEAMDACDIDQTKEIIKTVNIINNNININYIII